MGIADPIKVAPRQREACVAVSGPLVEAILKQKHCMQETKVVQQAVKQQLHHEHQREAKSEAVALLLNEGLTDI